jgi:Mg/Co/Ni transporter MgtE
VAVQRRLARKMAEAQAGWIVMSEKEKTMKKKKKTTAEFVKTEEGEDVLVDETTSADEDEDALYNLSLVNATAFEEAFSRGKWLLFLLVLQSCSSFVLSSNEALIQDNVIITLYLTMLVGAGGNAGNQSAIEVITGLATGAIEYNGDSFRKTISKQLQVGALLGFFLGAGSFVRVYVTNRDLIGSFAISAACFSIVLCSTIVGGALPYVLIFCGQEPANAGSSVQVCMDVLGVTITCLVCTYIFQNADFVVGMLHSTAAA